MTNESGIVVVAERAQGRLTDLTHEILGLARRLAGEHGGTVSAIAFGEDLAGIGQELVAQGADAAVLVEGDMLEPYRADAWLPDLVKLIQDTSPAAVLIGHTTLGTDLAPRLAFRIESAVATGCEAVAIEDGKILLTRACYGGKLREVVSFTTAPSVATIKSKSQAPLARDDAREGAVATVPAGVSDADIRTTIAGQERHIGEGVRLENASVVVAGGGGLGGPEGFEAIARLADVLGGAVGASRVACDLGWCPPHYQIGLSGKTVAPELYIAVGISGAGQHLAGCANARAIVAINNDVDAQIFQFARFGVIGGYQDVVPALVEEIEKLRR